MDMGQDMFRAETPRALLGGVLALAFVLTVVGIAAGQDETPPSIFSASLYPQYVGVNTFFLITASVSDDVGVETVIALVSGPVESPTFTGSAQMTLDYGTVQSGNWSVRPFSFPDPTVAPDGTYQVDITASDGAGNSATVSAGTAVLDRTPPDTSILSATNPIGRAVPDGGRTGFDTITFTFAGTDSVGIAFFDCTLDGVFTASCGSPYTLSDLTRGTHVLRVAAVDLAGNADSTPAQFTWTVRH